MSVQVVLTPGECRIAAYTGVNRRLEAMAASRVEVYGKAAGGAYWETDLEAAAAELALAKALGVHWCGMDGPDKDTGDVAGAQVRHTKRENGSLICHDRDADDHRFVLVTGSMPAFTVRGWILGGDAKDKRFWRDRPAVPRPAFFVPQSALKPLV